MNLKLQYASVHSHPQFGARFDAQIQGKGNDQQNQRYGCRSFSSWHPCSEQFEKTNFKPEIKIMTRKIEETNSDRMVQKSRDPSSNRSVLAPDPRVKLVSNVPVCLSIGTKQTNQSGKQIRQATLQRNLAIKKTAVAKFCIANLSVIKIVRLLEISQNVQNHFAHSTCGS